MDVTHTLDVDAPIERLWELTLDLERWPEITPTVIDLELVDPGAVGVGTRARLKQPGQRRRIWTVTEVEPMRRFTWSARVLGSTLTGIHELESTGSGVRSTLGIAIEGRSAPLLRLLVRRPIASAIATENESFKAVAETSTLSS